MLDLLLILQLEENHNQLNSNSIMKKKLFEKNKEKKRTSISSHNPIKVNPPSSFLRNNCGNFPLLAETPNKISLISF